LPGIFFNSFSAAMRLYKAVGGIEAPRDSTMFTFPLPDEFAASIPS
jgi:hypothetical protein